MGPNTKSGFDKMRVIDAENVGYSYGDEQKCDLLTYRSRSSARIIATVESAWARAQGHMYKGKGGFDAWSFGAAQGPSGLRKRCRGAEIIFHYIARCATSNLTSRLDYN